MSAHKLDIISQAQRGNPKALSDLLNRALESKQIKIRAKLVQQHLTIFAEGDEIPNQQSLIGIIKRGVKDLGIDTLVSIKVYGKKTNTSNKGWIDEIFLKDAPTTTVKLPISHPRASAFNWHTFRQFTQHMARQMLAHGRNLVTNKRFIISSAGVVLTALLIISGIAGVSVMHVRITQGKAIAEAKVLVSEANTSEASTLDELTTASEKLTNARNILRGIENSWGSLYASAQEELGQVRTALDTVKQRIDAEKSATSILERGRDMAQKAIQYVNTPPYPLNEWQKAKEELSQAIAITESIPTESSYAEQAKIVLAEYKQKLDWIEQEITNEQKAVQTLNVADQLARQAYDYTNGKSRFTAAELTNAKNLWEKAIDYTKTVPPTSDAYRHITERISLYTENINKIEDKLREMNECWTRSYASQSFCNSVYLYLRRPVSY
ncbi:hypothetical protein [Egbenema bharatensis]|uniref:hypothetical protein n=1 Tax=Egbenema bharatensis TaxID=3463334 RepID=UPI003A88FAA0